MLFRSVAKATVGESTRANPLDLSRAVGRATKRRSLLMRVASYDLRAIMVSGGPMGAGNIMAKISAPCTNVWKFSEPYGSSTAMPPAAPTQILPILSWTIALTAPPGQFPAGSMNISHLFLLSANVMSPPPAPNIMLSALSW
jgi:hypothetical protein